MNTYISQALKRRWCELILTQFCSSDKNKISNRNLSLRNEANLIPFISLEIMNYLFEQTESF
jgi:hypothetical protein